MIKSKFQNVLKWMFSNRNHGFYVTLVAIIISLICSIVYATEYHTTPRFMSWSAFAVILVGSIISLFLLLFHFGEIASAVVALADLIGLMLFVYVIYNYVAVVMAGIDLSSFEARFIICCVLMGLSLVISIASIFTKQNKEVLVNEEKC